jgi:hypothetical protein
MSNKSQDERPAPQGGLPTPGVKIERKEGRVGAANESAGGEVKPSDYNRNSRE